MIYVKSILAGIAAFLLYAILFTLIVIVFMMHQHPPQMPTLVPPPTSDSSVGFDVTTTWTDHSIPDWLFLLPGTVVFAGAFYWMFRRFRRQGASQQAG